VLPPKNLGRNDVDSTVSSMGTDHPFVAFTSGQ